MPKFSLPLSANPFIPHGSGYCEWRIIDANGAIVATVDPCLLLESDEAADLAGFIADTLSALLRVENKTPTAQDVAKNYGCTMRRNPAAHAFHVEN